MWLNLVIFSVLVCMGSGQITDYAVGDPCEASDGGMGECTFLSRCEYGVDLVLNYGFHNLTRCGFEGKFEIVCCVPILGDRFNSSLGDPCVASDGGKGKCTVLSECDNGINLVQQYRNHNLTRCDFEGKTEVVCCVPILGDRFSPITSERPASTTKLVARPLASNGLPVRQEAPQSRPTPERAAMVPFMDATGDSGGPLRPARIQKVAEIDYPVGDPCEASDGGMGECTFLSRCEYGVDLVQNNGFHNLTRCGFEETTEIVCCVPNFGDRISPITSERPASTTTLVARPLPASKTAPVWPDRRSAFGDTVAERGLGNDVPKTLSIVRIGVLNITGPYNLLTDYNVSRSVLHPDFKERYNDIALVELDRLVALSATVYPGCLYVRPEDPVGRLIATGWGATSFDEGGDSSVLLKTNLNFVPHAQCVEEFAPFVPRVLQRGIIESMVCAVGENGKDNCRGDSGGPLQALTERDGHYRIIGITSFGIDCGTEVPAVYSRVVSFLDWIEATVWPDQI